MIKILQNILISSLHEFKNHCLHTFFISGGFFSSFNFFLNNVIIISRLAVLFIISIFVFVLLKTNLDLPTCQVLDHMGHSMCIWI